MARINLIRIDSRLIHGQVITKWLKEANADKIVIIDNFLSKDSLMSNIYIMAAPKDVPVEIYDVEKGVEEWKKEQFGDGNILLLFKDVANCYEAFCKGFPMEQIQIGGLPSGPGRTIVFRAVSFDKQDVEQLKDMENKGVEVILHIIPEGPKIEFKKAIRRIKFE